MGAGVIRLSLFCWACHDVLIRLVVCVFLIGMAKVMANSTKAKTT